MYLARVSSYPVVLYLGPMNTCNSVSIMQAKPTFVPSYGMLLQQLELSKTIYFSSPGIHLDPPHSLVLCRVNI